MTKLYYENLYRTETDQTVIDTLLRKGWQECPAPVYDPQTQVVEWNSSTQQWDISNIPTPPPPDEIPLWAFRVVLRVNGLKDSVEALINALPEPQKSLVLDQYEYGNFIVRTHPLVQSLGSQLGLSSQDIDNLFISASQLK